MLFMMCGCEFFEVYGVVIKFGLLVGVVVWVVVVFDENNIVLYSELVFEIKDEFDYVLVLVVLV